MNLTKQIPPLSHIIPVIGLILAMAWNIPHLVKVYADTVQVQANLYHYAMMIIIEFSVLVFAVKKYEYSAKTFAWFIFFLNLYYYFDFEEKPITWEWLYLWFAFSRVLFSAIPAYLISYYSELFANTFSTDYMNDRDKLERLRITIDNLSVELENDRETIEKFRPAFESLSKKAGSKISVEGVKSTVCDCGRLVSAGSNKEQSRVCECGETIEW